MPRDEIFKVSQQRPTNQKATKMLHAGERKVSGAMKSFLSDTSIYEQNPFPLLCSIVHIFNGFEYFICVTQFSRSCVGSSKYLMNAHLNAMPDVDLVFESRFESGNLAKAIKITPVYYELYLRSDLYTNKHNQWFYFRVSNVKKGFTYRYLYD